MAKQKKKLNAAQKTAKKQRQKEYMTIFVNGKQKSVRRPVKIDGMDPDEFIRRNADPIWLHQNEMWEYMDHTDDNCGESDMLKINIPDKLTSRINELAKQVYQTPEQYIIELIEERVEHESAYVETAYLAKSDSNRKRLDKAVEDIKSGKFEPHGLIND